MSVVCLLSAFGANQHDQTPPRGRHTGSPSRRLLSGKASDAQEWFRSSASAEPALLPSAPPDGPRQPHDSHDTTVPPLWLPDPPPSLFPDPGLAANANTQEARSSSVRALAPPAPDPGSAAWRELPPQVTSWRGRDTAGLGASPNGIISVVGPGTFVCCVGSPCLD